MITVLAMGQSNATGAQPGGPDTFPGVTVWNNQGSVLDLANLGTAFVTPVLGSDPFSVNGPINNMMAHACKVVAARSGVAVRLILISKGGQSIDAWTDASGVRGPLYARMVAVLAAAGVASVDALLWHQGEADNGSPGTYASRWAKLLSNLTADGYITGDTPIVIGETAQQYTGINPVLNSIAAASPRVAIARIANLEVVGSHFTGPSLVEAGSEYARRLSEISTLAEGALPDSMTKVSFCAAKSAVQSIALSSQVKVTFPVVRWNEGGHYDATNSRFTPPLGRYRFALSLLFTGHAPNATINVSVFKNGQLFRRARLNTHSSGNPMNAELSFLDEASGTDYYEAYCYGGGGAPVVSSDSLSTWFEAEEL